MSYTINFTNTTVFGKLPALTVADQGTNTGTSLRLLGKGTTGYGETLWTNMVHMLENFCSNSEPSNKTIGQLWYDSGNKTLKVCEIDATGTGTKWTSVGGTTNTPASYFTTDANGLTLPGTYNLNITASQQINANLTVVGDTTVSKLTASKAVLSSVKNSDNTYMNMITSDDPKFKPYFVTKEYADEHYLRGTNFQNANEFDASATFDVIKMPGEVIFTGMIKQHTSTVTCAAGSNYIDLTGDTFTEGTIFTVVGFQGHATNTPVIKLPSAIDYNGQKITVEINYDGVNGRGKALSAKDMGSGASGTEIRWPGGTLPTTSTTATGGVDVFEFRSIADKWHGVVIGLGFK